MSQKPRMSNTFIVARNWTKYELIFSSRFYQPWDRQQQQKKIWWIVAPEIIFTSLFGLVNEHSGNGSEGPEIGSEFAL